VKTCPDCDGDGVIEKGTDDEQRCPTCGGRVSCLMTTMMMKMK
jgi:DnaJ-class molecular chaperone